MGGIRTFQGAVAIVTGGASGIGRALGEELARRGAAEVVIADVQTALAEETAETVRRAGARATVVTTDVRDAEAVERLIEGAHRRAGRIDYVFNNAGTGVMGEAHLLEKRDWNLTIDINVGGLVNVIRSAYPRLIAQGYGHLVNTASVAGLIGSPFLSVYVGTKHFVVGVSKSMRVEAAPHGVRVSALCPGAVRTPLLTGGSIGRSIYEMSDERKLAWWERFRPGNVDVFATQTLDAVAKNEGVIILPKHNRIGVALFRMLPALEERIAAKIHGKTLADFPEMKATKKPAAAPTPPVARVSSSN
jgi:NAD(P)-dependent dehydrogenase (short-subunit alcohol dehydrogenase family)